MRKGQDTSEFRRRMKKEMRTQKPEIAGLTSGELLISGILHHSHFGASAPLGHTPCLGFSSDD
jgi:hypothetical protein